MTDFTSLAQLKRFLDLDATTDNDYLLSGLISQVSEAIRLALGRDVVSGSYTSTFDGGGGSRLALPQYPVTAVASVTIDGNAVAARTDVTSTDAAYVFTPYSLNLIGCSFNAGFQNCVIQYTAGLATVPPSLEQACLRWAAFLYAKNGRIDFGSKAMAQETTAYLNASMPPDVRLVLAQWRRVSFR